MKNIGDKMKYEILQTYSFTEGRMMIEFKINIEDTRLLVIYGRHINGYFIAMPELHISCEATIAGEIRKNTIFLSQAGIRSDYADAICRAIKEIWEKGE